MQLDPDEVECLRKVMMVRIHQLERYFQYKSDSASYKAEMERVNDLFLKITGEEKARGLLPLEERSSG